MGNMKAEISKNNKSQTHPTNLIVTAEEKNECPLQGNCQATKVIYKVEVSTANNGENKQYIGMTATEFK